MQECQAIKRVVGLLNTALGKTAAMHDLDEPALDEFLEGAAEEASADAVGDQCIVWRCQESVIGPGGLEVLQA